MSTLEPWKSNGMPGYEILKYVNIIVTEIVHNYGHYAHNSPQIYITLTLTPTQWRHSMIK